MAVTLSDINPNVPNCSGENCSGLFFLPQDIIRNILLKYLKGRDITSLSLGNRHLFITFFSDNSIIGQLFKEFFPHSFAEFSENPAEEKIIPAFNQARLRKKNAKSGDFLFQTHDCTKPGTSVTHNAQLYYVDGKEIKIWDYQNGKEITLKTSITPDSDYGMISIENDYLMVGSEDKTIIFDVKTLKELRAIPHLPQNWANQTRLIYKDQLFFGFGNGRIDIWDLKDLARAPKTVQAHADTILKMLIHNDRLYTGSVRTVKIWDPDNMSELRKLEGHLSLVNNIFMNENSLAVVDYCRISIWDLLEKDSAPISFRFEDQINASLSHEKMPFFAARNQITMQDPNNLAEPLKCFTSGDLQPIFKIAVYDGLLIGADLKSIKIWEILPHIIKTSNYSPSILKDSSKNFVVCKGRLFSSPFNGQIKIWDFNRPPTQEISLLKQINIVSKEDFLEKLNCDPDFLPKVGIYSDEDLKVLGIMSGQPGLEKLCQYLHQKDLALAWQKLHLKGIYTLSQLSAIPESTPQGFFKLNQI